MRTSIDQDEVPQTGQLPAADESRDSASRIDFFTWTTAIGEHYFPKGVGSEAVYLSFDDSIATQIGRAFGASVQDFEVAVSSAIDADDEHPFRRAEFTRDGHVGVLGIIAAQVLAATRMGSFTAEAATAYWKPFQRAFTNDRLLRNPALDTLDTFWAQTRDHYASLNRGRLAIQSDPRQVPLAGKRHINLPLFQALLREVDRAQIRSWFLDYPEEMALPAATALRHIIENAPSFNKKLTQTLRDAAANRVLANALQTQVSELMAAATGNKNQSPRQRAAGRLRLVGLRALECFLQRQNGQRWIDVATELNDDSIRHGFEDEISGARWRGDDRVLFIDRGNEGYVSQHGIISPGATVVVLFDQDDSTAKKAVIDVRAENLQLASSIERFSAWRFVVAEDDSQLLDLFACSLATARALRLEGGLSDRRVWLSTNPPKIVVAPGISRVTVNGHLILVENNNQVVLRPPLATGHYVVEAAGERIAFDVEDGRTLYDSQDGEEIVYSLTPPMNTCPIEKLSASHYLVGAYIGVKPT